LKKYNKELNIKKIYIKKENYILKKIIKMWIYILILILVLILIEIIGRLQNKLLPKIYSDNLKIIPNNENKKIYFNIYNLNYKL
jgi:hypothetical protein